MNTTALDLPVNSITNALSQLLDLQEDSPNNHKFESLISSLQDAHTALTNLQATQQPVQTPPAATSTSTPTPTPPPPLIAKFHPNLILPFVKAIRTLDKDLNLVQDVLRDVEAGMENLDKMGIIIRPRCVDGKIELLEWQFGIPGRAGSEWEGSLFKGTFTFPPNYPNTSPQVKTSPPLFHPNVYSSGRVPPSYRFRDSTKVMEWPEVGGITELCNTVGGDTIESSFDEVYRETNQSLRLPLLLNTARLVIHFPRLTDAVRIEAATLATDIPEEYEIRQKQEAASLLPTPQDLLDLEDAQKRVRERQVTG